MKYKRIVIIIVLVVLILICLMFALIALNHRGGVAGNYRNDGVSGPAMLKGWVSEVRDNNVILVECESDSYADNPRKKGEYVLIHYEDGTCTRTDDEKNEIVAEGIQLGEYLSVSYWKSDVTKDQEENKYDYIKASSIFVIPEEMTGN